jgi:hypothetical protein
MLPFVLTGATGLHAHEDGTCHTHPAAPGDDHHDDDGTPLPTPCDWQAPGDAACVRILFPTDAGISPHSTATLTIAPESGPDLRISDGNSYLLACGPPAGVAAISLYLSHRRLLL